MKKTLVTVVGARPQFVKAATLSRALLGHKSIEEKIIHTGQHYDASMSDVFFQELKIPKPYKNLSLGGGKHGEMTGKMLGGIEEILLETNADAVLVYGDTNSTLAGALAAAKLHIPVIHVEAGLRSFNRRMPEEINRVLTDHMSAILYAPTVTAVANLQKEGITKGVETIGDVSFDATLYAINQSRAHSKIIENLGIKGMPFAVCTLHRAENTDNEARFKRIVAYLIQKSTDTKIVFPVHPRTKSLIEKIAHNANIQLIDPVGYFDMHALIAASTFIITDSGGLQKEAYFHQKPCITLRDETEWIETIEAGWNMLWTVEDFKFPRKAISDYGDGDAAGKIVQSLECFFAS